MIGKRVKYKYQGHQGCTNYETGVITDKILIDGSDFYLIRLGSTVTKVRCDKVIEIF